MPIPNKRRALAEGLRAVGLTGLLARTSSRPGLLVLGYHRIASTEPGTFDGVVSAEPAAFERQVRDLRDHFRLLRLDEAIEAAGSGFDLGEPCALITFDDGYLDNFTRALPILRSLGVPAAFFLNSGSLERPRPFWWDHVAWILEHATVGQFTVDRPRSMTFNLSGNDGRSTAMRTIISWFLDGSVGDEASYLDDLGRRAGVEVDAGAIGRRLLMSRSQARELAAAGMGIGSHGHSHRHLARLPEGEQQEELSKSKQMLEEISGRPVEAIAYPYGVAGSYDEGLTRRARESGYRLGFCFEGGINRPGETDPMAVRRINVGVADSPEMVRARALSFSALGRSWI